MVLLKNDCVSCISEFNEGPCNMVEHYYCDVCREEYDKDEIAHITGTEKDICFNCLEKKEVTTMGERIIEITLDEYKKFIEMEIKVEHFKKCFETAKYPSDVQRDAQLIFGFEIKEQ